MPALVVDTFLRIFLNLLFPVKLWSFLFVIVVKKYLADFIFIIGLIFFFYNGILLVYSAMLVSGVQQRFS